MNNTKLNRRYYYVESWRESGEDGEVGRKSSRSPSRFSIVEFL